VLILLPPSEGKQRPRRGKPVDPDAGPLAGPRRQVRDALVELCRGPEAHALQVLGLSPGQVEDARLNRRLADLPSAPAERVYTGVRYEWLGRTTLDASAHRRALARVAIVSSLYGVVRPGERITAYRLSGGVNLPGVGGVAAFWRRHLDPVVGAMAGRGLVVDLRSSTYAGFWRPAPELAPRIVTVRVLHEVNVKRQVVSHFNKATKGRLVRTLLVDGRDARTPAGLAALLTELGWQVDTAGRPTKTGTRLDVVVSEL
jgi:cytoplasmic iron level regulating protein YaaA (DUF328/UPF0246 family)